MQSLTGDLSNGIFRTEGRFPMEADPTTDMKDVQEFCG